MRPSWGAIDVTKVIPSATSLDTLGVFARSATMLERVMGSWQAVEKSPLEQGAFTLPKKIFYPVSQHLCFFLSFSSFFGPNRSTI